MRSAGRQKLAVFAVCWGMLIASALFLSGFAGDRLADSDRYWNLGLAQVISKEGLIRALPQFPLIGWNDHFVEKEFLYHEFLGLLAWVGGDRLVELSAPFLALVLLTMMFSVLSHRQAPLWSAIIVAVLILANPNLLRREFLLRSFVLGQIIFLATLVALQRNRHYWVAGLSALYVLSYTNWPILLILIVVHLPFVEIARERKRCLLAILAGAAVGIMANPIYPNQLPAVFAGLSAPGRGYAGLGIRYAVDTVSISLMETLQKYGFLILTALTGAACAWNVRAKRPLCLLAILFSVWIFQFKRMSEYLLIVAIFVIPDVLERFRGKRFRAAPAFVAIGLIVGTLPNLGLFTEGTPKSTVREVDAVRIMLAKVPTGERILNTEYSLGAYGFFARKDLQFVDANDPTYLLLEAPELHVLRERLYRGEKLDWASVIPGKFGARWIITESPATGRVLLADPRFRLIWTGYGTKAGTGAPLSYLLIQLGS